MNSPRGPKRGGGKRETKEERGEAGKSRPPFPSEASLGEEMGPLIIEPGSLMI